MTQKLRRWLALAPADRAAVVEAWLLLLLVDLGLRWPGLARIERLLASAYPGRQPAARAASATVAGLWRWIGAAAANHPCRARCLERSLVLRAMLARRGLSADLRIGVRRDGTGLDAHAWLECDGRPLVEANPEARGYRSLQPAAGER